MNFSDSISLLITSTLPFIPITVIPIDPHHGSLYHHLPRETCRVHGSYPPESPLLLCRPWRCQELRRSRLCWDYQKNLGIWAIRNYGKLSSKRKSLGVFSYDLTIQTSDINHSNWIWMGIYSMIYIFGIHMGYVPPTMWAIWVSMGHSPSSYSQFG